MKIDINKYAKRKQATILKDLSGHGIRDGKIVKILDVGNDGKEDYVKVQYKNNIEYIYYEEEIE